MVSGGDGLHCEPAWRQPLQSILTCELRQRVLHTLTSPLTTHHSPLDHSQSIPLPFAVQRARVDAQHRGGRSIVGVAARTRRMCSASSRSSVTSPPTSTVPCGNCGADLGRQVRQADSVPAAQDDAALDGVAQFADVAGPRIAGDGRARLGAERRDRLARLPGEEPQQMLRQRQDVARRSRSGGQHHLDDVEAIEQVLAESPRGGIGGQVAVGGGQDADVAERASASRRRARTAAPAAAAAASAARRAADSPISSRNSVPPSAAATLPKVSCTAPVNAPWTWPNSSLSSNSADRLGQ